MKAPPTTYARSLLFSGISTVNISTRKMIRAIIENAVITFRASAFDMDSSDFNPRTLMLEHQDIQGYSILIDWMGDQGAERDPNYRSTHQRNREPL